MQVECIAEDTCRGFLDKNHVRQPELVYAKTTDPNICGRYNRASETVFVYLKNCRVGSRSRSYPGFWEDLSVLGVMAHEFGHHVENVRGWRNTINGAYYDVYVKEIPLARNARKDRHEDFADALMIFITNPSLLASLNPMRHAFMTDNLGLVPSETRDWREVLRGSPEHVAYVEERLS